MKCALILITGDRLDYVDYSIRSCKEMILAYNQNIEVDIFLITFRGIEIKSQFNFTQFTFDKPNQNQVDEFPKSHQQVQNYSSDIDQNRRISFGHYILNGSVPDTIFRNSTIFRQYDFILKSRTDLVFDFNRNDLQTFNPENQVLTFECFWGGCRYNPHFTNDHLVFGKSEDVLKIISYPISNCLMNKFWNPENYTTYLFSQTLKQKREISTDKYFLLSNDRKSRKWIGFPLEKIKKTDFDFLEKIGLDVSKLSFDNEYEL